MNSRSPGRGCGRPFKRKKLSKEGKIKELIFKNEEGLCCRYGECNLVYAWCQECRSFERKRGENLSGRIGTFGQRVLGRKVDKIAEEFVKNFVSKLSENLGGSVGFRFNSA